MDEVEKQLTLCRISMSRKRGWIEGFIAGGLVLSLVWFLGGL